MVRGYCSASAWSPKCVRLTHGDTGQFANDLLEFRAGHRLRSRNQRVAYAPREAVLPLGYPWLAEAYLTWQAGRVDRVGTFIEALALVYGIRLRMLSTEFAGLFLQAWEVPSAFAIMTGLSATGMHPIANKHTARFMATLVEPNSD